MPARLIEKEDGVTPGAIWVAISARCRLHRLGVARRQDQGRRLAVLRTDRAEDIGRGGSLIFGSAEDACRAWPSVG